MFISWLCRSTPRSTRIEVDVQPTLEQTNATTVVVQGSPQKKTPEQPRTLDNSYHYQEQNNSNHIDPWGIVRRSTAAGFSTKKETTSSGQGLQGRPGVLTHAYITLDRMNVFKNDPKKGSTRQLQKDAWRVWNDICHSADLNGMHTYAPGMTPQNYMQFCKRPPYQSRKFQSYVVNVCSEVPQYDGAPWKAMNKNYSMGLEGLTEEINDFFVYAQPNAADQSRREQVIEKVRAAIREKWPDCVVEVFGSYKTGLYLPSGDIDMVIQGNWEVIPPLFDLERQLIDKKIGDRQTFKVLDKASVPLIKFKDAETDIRVDLSFNQANCTEAAAFVKQCCRTFPPLAKLIFVLKQYLSLHGLNEVFHGGISSYSLTLMIVSFLQLHPEQDMVRSEKAETGKLLVDFLEFYGDRFEYDKMGIRIKDGGSLVDKNELRECLVAAGGPPTTCSNLLCIEDPLTAGNDVARSSYAMTRVRDAFKSAFTCLQRYVHPTLYQIVGNPRPTVLGQIITIPNHVAYSRYLTSVPEDLGHSKITMNQSVRKITNDYNNMKQHSGKKRQRKWNEDRSDRERSRPSTLGHATIVEDKSFDLIINGPPPQMDKKKGRASTEVPKCLS